MMLPGIVANDWPGTLFSDRNPISLGGRLSAISCLQAARDAGRGVCGERKVWAPRCPADTSSPPKLPWKGPITAGS